MVLCLPNYRYLTKEDNAGFYYTCALHYSDVCILYNEYSMQMSLASFGGALGSAVNTKRAKRFSNLEANEFLTFAILSVSAIMS